MAAPHKPGGRAGLGRKPGSKNKINADLRDLARQYTVQSLEALVGVLRREDSPAIAIVAAANAILDRGHGKPRQDLGIEGKLTLEQLIVASYRAGDERESG